MTNHCVSDLCARLKNAYLAKKEIAIFPNSKLSREVFAILKENGFVNNFSVQKSKHSNSKHDNIIVSLKYTAGIPALMSIGPLSKPGKRVYCKHTQIPKFYNGLGCVIISTSRGVLTDLEAINKKLGGELLLKAF